MPFLKDGLALGLSASYIYRTATEETNQVEMLPLDKSNLSWIYLFTI